MGNGVPKATERSAAAAARRTPVTPEDVTDGKYLVRRGDTLSHIARELKIPLGDLKAANAHISNPNFIAAGKKITIPEPGTEKPTTSKGWLATGAAKKPPTQVTPKGLDKLRIEVFRRAQENGSEGNLTTPQVGEFVDDAVKRFGLTREAAEAIVEKVMEEANVGVADPQVQRRVRTSESTLRALGTSIKVVANNNGGGLTPKQVDEIARTHGVDRNTVVKIARDGGFGAR